MILVAGSTNELGCEICYSLASQGISIRALVTAHSDPAWVERLKNFGATLAIGDPHDPLFLSDACIGINRVICSPMVVAGGRQEEALDLSGALALIDEAREADIQRFVLISFSLSEGKEKPVIEQHLVESGVPYTIFQAGSYPAPDPGVGVQPAGRNSYKDLARLVTQCLRNPAQRNAVIDLAAPKSMGHSNLSRGITGHVSH
jgi:uncharacterized protein YbjT (DUF2867 family)